MQSKNVFTLPIEVSEIMHHKKRLSRRLYRWKFNDSISEQQRNNLKSEIAHLTKCLRRYFRQRSERDARENINIQPVPPVELFDKEELINRCDLTKDDNKLLTDKIEQFVVFADDLKSASEQRSAFLLFAFDIALQLFKTCEKLPTAYDNERLLKKPE